MMIIDWKGETWGAGRNDARTWLLKDHRVSSGDHGLLYESLFGNCVIHGRTYRNLGVAGSNRAHYDVVTVAWSKATSML